MFRRLTGILELPGMVNDGVCRGVAAQKEDDNVRGRNISGLSGTMPVNDPAIITCRGKDPCRATLTLPRMLN